MMSKTQGNPSTESSLLNEDSFINAKKKSNLAINKSLKITSVYFLFGCAWIVLTDLLTSEMQGVSSIVLNISILKGLFYVSATAALIFVLIYSTIRKLVALKESLQISNDKLEISNNELHTEIEKCNTIENALLKAQRQAHIGSFEYDFTSKHLTCTDESLRICGLDRSSFSESLESILELICPDDRSHVYKLCEHSKIEKKVSDFECRLNQSNGEERIVHIRFEPMSLENTEHMRAFGTIQDITDRKNTETALKESERSKSVLISHLPGLAYRCSYDKNWTMLFISEGCYELTGYRPESLIENEDLSYNDIICEEYRETLWNEWERVLAANIPFRYEYEITTAMGERKWVWEMGQGVYDQKGKLEALEGLVIDITESKQRFNQIQYMIDHDTLTDVYNRSFYENAKNQLDEETYHPLSIIIADINGVRLINDAFGHAVGDKLIVETAKIIQGCCGENDILARTGGDEFSIISPNTDQEKADKIRESINRACELYNASVKDKALVINLSLGYGVKQNSDGNIEETEKSAKVFMDKRKLLEKKSHHNTILTSIMATMYARSNETEEHAQRLAQLSKMIGENMHLSQASLDELQLLSMLHDIGKIGIDDRILNKAGSLTIDEWVSMRKHPEIGYMIATSSPDFAPIAEYVLSHHERWDGTGYPRGLCGDEIPLLSRILAVVDAYDAMTEDRVYRKALSKESAIEEIRINAGTQFDPNVARIFVESIQADKCVNA